MLFHLRRIFNIANEKWKGMTLTGIEPQYRKAMVSTFYLKAYLVI